MKAMAITHLADLREDPEPLDPVELPDPDPGPGEVRLAVRACGVCHTELDEIEGRTPPPRLPVVPGHEVVGVVDALGEGVTAPAPGTRVGVGWIWCSSGEEDENLSPAFQATGRDHDGGYAQYMVAQARYTVPIPEVFADEEAAPLLCAGAIGYRALRLTGARNGSRLGLTGFGASAHLVLQTVRHLWPDTAVHVFARDPDQRRHALELGATWAGDIADRSPEPLDAIIDTTPVWKPVVEALADLAPGGRLVINAIRKEDADKHELLRLRYEDHLWMEREIKTVANITRRDLAEFLPLAAAAGIRPTVTVYPLAEANRALRELRAGGGRGAKVLCIGGGDGA